MEGTLHARCAAAGPVLDAAAIREALICTEPLALMTAVEALAENECLLCADSPIELDRRGAPIASPLMASLLSCGFAVRRLDAGVWKLEAVG